MNTLTDEVMDYEGLSAYLKMSEGTLRHRVMNSTIPYFKIGRCVRFSKRQINIWLEKQQRNNSGNAENDLFPVVEVVQ